MNFNVKHVLKRLERDERGITALETAIILIAFVVVASVFAFTILSAGTFSTERGKEAIYAGLSSVQSSMEIKGSVIATATMASPGVTGTVTAVVFTVANAVGGEPINLSETEKVLVIDYRDAKQSVPVTDWSLVWLGNGGDGDDLLEPGELAQITVPLEAAKLGINTDFTIEIKPPTGAVLNIQRTTPAYLEVVNDLQ
jgi:flagellin FlaB